jgi:hypothetical protein
MSNLLMRGAGPIELKTNAPLLYPMLTKSLVTIEIIMVWHDVLVYAYQRFSW